MPDEKAPSSGAFLPLSLMYFLSGEPMHYLSGVDRLRFGSCRDTIANIIQTILVQSRNK